MGGEAKYTYSSKQGVWSGFLGASGHTTSIPIRIVKKRSSMKKIQKANNKLGIIQSSLVAWNLRKEMYQKYEV